MVESNTSRSKERFIHAVFTSEGSPLAISAGPDDSTSKSGWWQKLLSKSRKSESLAISGPLVLSPRPLGFSKRVQVNARKRVSEPPRKNSNDCRARRRNLLAATDSCRRATGVRKKLLTVRFPLY